MSDCVNSSVGCNGSTTIVGCDGSDIEACLDNILAQANQVCDSCFSVETRLSKVRAILVNMSQFIQDCNITIWKGNHGYPPCDRTRAFRAPLHQFRYRTPHQARSDDWLRAI